MFSKQQPVVGAWYVNRTGKLMKVKLMAWQHQRPVSVLIEYLDGKRQVVDMQAWYMLELSRNLQQAARSLLQQ
ncbi:MAG TPA: hypothetical protein ENK40_02830 [Gammaproteobacteria bacterium]|nr:hypothetical protein [Gammaproteobacteria bacterium]